MNLASVLRTTAQRLPDMAALVEGEQTITYADLHAHVDAAARHLRAHGVGTHDRVAVAVRSGGLAVLLLYAASRLGAAACIVDWRAKPAEREAILSMLTARLLLVDRPLVGSCGTAVATVDASWQTPPDSADLPDISDPDLPAVLALSSGTTGLPKAMVVTQRAALYRSLLRAHENDLQPGRRVLSVIPMTATAALQGILGQVLAGATSFQFPSLYSPEELLDALLHHRIEQTTLVPTTVRWMLERAPANGLLLPDMRMLRVAGAAFHPEEKAAVMQRLTPNLFESYGSAGTGGVTKASPQDLHERPTSVGRALLSVAIEIVDEVDVALPPGTVGRVRVRTLASANGYFGASGSEERDEVFRDGWSYPGDLGRLDHDGYLYLEGRAASLIIRAGQNIYPEEIERTLLSHAGVAEAVVIGVPHPSLGEVPVAIVVLHGAMPEADLMAHCRLHLQSHKVPAAFRIVPAIPKNATGKVARAELSGLIE